MKWGLTHGMIGRKLASLSPSGTALGPNTYLSQQDFLKMLGIAFVVHVVIFAVAALFPHQKVNNIPVRALSFKLGDPERVAAAGATSGVGISMNAPPPAPVMSAASHDAWQATPHAAPQAIPAPLKPIARPPVAREASRYVPTPKVVPVAEPTRAAPVENQPTPLAPLPAATPAIAPNPQQYVREVGGPSPQLLAGLPSTAPLTNDGAAGGQAALSAQAEDAIRDTYEKQISRWIDLHRFYPAAAGGKSGRVVLLVRIDRGGTVRYCAIEQSSGVDALDAAAMEMIRLANPMPNVPLNYPPGDLIAFEIPINMRPGQ